MAYIGQAPANKPLSASDLAIVKTIKEPTYPPIPSNVM